MRIYLDTSVFGGCFATRFHEDSNALLNQVIAGKFTLVVSEILLHELSNAPEKVRALLPLVPSSNWSLVLRTAEILQLRDAYLAAKIVGPASGADAEHIATASVSRVDAIVSWNFKHIVHMDKIRGYHSVNLFRGYPLVPIHTPSEVRLP
jgi:predicted nucleic acid-binding protein